MVFKKIRKSHVDWRDFLCGTPASDYIFQKDAYEEQIENAVNFIKDADAVIIGAGAGASTAAGLWWKEIYRSFCRIYRKIWRSLYDRYVCRRILSISIGGSQMGILVETCTAQQI